MSEEANEIEIDIDLSSIFVDGNILEKFICNLKLYLPPLYRRNKIFEVFPTLESYAFYVAKRSYEGYFPVFLKEAREAAIKTFDTFNPDKIKKAISPFVTEEMLRKARTIQEVNKEISQKEFDEIINSVSDFEVGSFDLEEISLD